ncbi:MAG: PQQ-binding-like beta-propeller repeat protein, partial [Chloroflexales bacterium]
MFQSKWQIQFDGNRYLLIALGLCLLVLSVTLVSPASSETSIPSNVLISAKQASLSAADAWPMFQHDQQHTGRSSQVGPQTTTLRWNFPTNGVPSSPAVGGDGTVYLPVGMLNKDTTGSLYAINPDGTQKWLIPLNILPSSTAPALGPDGTIYVHGNGSNGNLVAVEQLQAITPSGTIAWTFQFNGGLGIFANDIQSSPAIGADGTIYVGSIDTKLYALNPDGTIKWTRSPTTSSITSSPSVAIDGTIYIHDAFGLYAYTPSGVEKWHTSVNVAGRESGAPSIGTDGTIYFAHAGNKEFYAVNPDGTIKWQYTLGFSPSSTPAIAADGTIYISDDGLYALNPDGTLKWRFHNQSSFVPPVIGGDGLIYWREAWTAYAINPNGTEKWNLPLNPYAGSDPTLAIGPDGTLYLPISNTFNSSFGQSGLNAYDASVTPSPTPTVPSPTVPSPTPTVPSPTPTVPSPTPTVPSPTPTVPSPTPTVPSPTPTVPS